MSLVVESHTALAAVGRAAWLRLEEATPGATVFQSWWWLNAWWPVWGEGRPLVLTVREDGRLVGAAAFYIGADRRVGFIGEEHADYGNVLAVEDRKDVVAALVAALFARRAEWRRVRLCDVRLDTPLAQALREAGCVASAGVPCPRVRFAARPIAELLAKESLRRHERKLAKAGAVDFLHLDSAAEITPWMARFFDQHLERWALTETPSLFVRPRNREFYSELAATAEPGASLLFTVVRLAGVPVAMHFGLRSADELLWYKPTFDPRFADSGPGEVLLGELLRRAGREGCQGLDFTRGDEAFKLRFASEVRTVASFEAWPDATARRLAGVARAARARAVVALDRLGWKQPVSTLSQRAGRTATVWRAEGAGAVATRLRALWAQPRAGTLAVYARGPTPGGAGLAPARPTGFAVTYCRSIAELLTLADPSNSAQHELLRHAIRRFASGDELAVGHAAGTLVAWGWMTQVPPLPVTEIEAELWFPPDTRLCYDFRVLDAARGQGYYAALLRALAKDRASGYQVIYARTDHGASRAGIEAAGFSPLGTFAPGPHYQPIAGAAGPMLSVRPRPPGEPAAGR